MSAGADDPQTEPARPDELHIGVTGTQVAASVLASVSAAVVASLFGVAGTILGAAVVSVVATVGGAAYSLGIHRTRDRLQQLQALQQLPSLRPGRPPRTGETAPAAASSEVPMWRDWLTRPRWSVAAGVAIVFVLSLSVVTLIELTGDRPLSGQGDSAARTSLGALLGGDDGGDRVGTDDHGEGDDPTSPDAGLPPEAPSSTTTPGDDDEGDSPATTAPHGGDGATPTTTPSTSTSSTTSTTSTTGPPPTTTGPADVSDTVPPADAVPQPAPGG